MDPHLGLVPSKKRHEEEIGTRMTDDKARPQSDGHKKLWKLRLSIMDRAESSVAVVDGSTDDARARMEELNKAAAPTETN